MSQSLTAHRSNNPSVLREPRSWYQAIDPSFWLFGRGVRTIANDRNGSDSGTDDTSLSETDKSRYSVRLPQREDASDVARASGVVKTNYGAAFRTVVSNGNGVISADGLSPQAAASLFNRVAGRKVDTVVLHQLLYFSEVATRHFSEGKRGFVNGGFIASETGPRLPDLDATSLKGRSKGSVTGVSPGSPYAVIAKHTYKLFGRLSPDVLCTISRLPGGAWERSREKIPETGEDALVIGRERITSDYHRIFEEDASQ